MGLLMGGLGMILGIIPLLIIAAIMVAFVVAIFIGIAALIVGGSTAAPALVFALLFTVGKSESLIVSILIFAVSYYVIEKMIQYRNVKNAIMVHLAVAASSIATYSVKMAITFLFKRSPALILLILLFGIMTFMLCSLLANDEQKNKKGYPVITRAFSSVLYGSAFISLLGSIIVICEINVPGFFTVILYVLWVLSGIAAYILDMKLSENEEIIRVIKELPVRKILKKYYDRYAKYILNRVARLNKHE